MLKTFDSDPRVKVPTGKARGPPSGSESCVVVGDHGGEA